MDTTLYNLGDVTCIFSRGVHFCFCLYTTAYFIFIKKRASVFSYFFALSGLLLTISVGIGTLARYYNVPWLTIELDGIFDLTIVPAFAVFGYSLIRQNTKWWKMFLAWGIAEIPLAICLVGYVIAPLNVYLVVSMVYTIILIVGVLIWGILQINRYNRLLKESYTNIDDKDLSWFKYIVAAMLGIVVSYFMIGKSYGLQYATDYQPIYFLGTEALILTIAFFVNKQQNVDDNILEETDKLLAGNSKSTDIVRDRLKAEFEDKKLYTKSSITIKDLADIMHSNSKYVSQYLNTTLHKNFNQYINELRINEACSIIQANRDITFEEVALAVGYNSRVTFWRIFQIEKKFTPTEFKTGLDKPNKDTNDRKNAGNDSRVDAIPAEPEVQAPKRKFYLSAQEKRLCLLILDGANTRQQYEGLGIQEDSLRVMRSRLRKRLQLKQKESLSEFIKQNQDLL